MAEAYKNYIEALTNPSVSADVLEALYEAYILAKLNEEGRD